MKNDNGHSKSENRTTIILVICAVLVGLSLFGLLVWQGLQTPEMSKTQVPSVLSQVIGVFKKGQDLLLRSEGAGISAFIPACATVEEGQFILTPLGPYLAGGGSEEPFWARIKIVDISFVDQNNNLVENMPVGCPITVCFTLDEDEWQRFSNAPGDFQIQYLDFDPTPAAWISLPKMSIQKTRELCAEHDRLGVFALAVLNLQPAKPGGLYDPSGLYEPVIP